MQIRYQNIFKNTLKVPNKFKNIKKNEDIIVKNGCNKNNKVQE